MGRPARRQDEDPTIYPEEERMGEESLQRFICELLRPLIEDYLQARGTPAFVGADQFIYYRKHDPHARVAPDVYVLPGVRPGRRIRSWKMWIEQVAPSFAVEVVSRDTKKDYAESPSRHDEAGTGELVVFDPDFEEAPDRVRFQVYRRHAQRGLVRVLTSNEDRVVSKALRCHLVVVGHGEAQRLRLGTGKQGEILHPTPEERERAEKERERAEKERERAEKERERALRIELEAEVARLRSELGGQRRR